MNELVKVFESEQFGKIRMVMIGNEPYAVGKDVAEALGYSNPQKAIRDHVDEEDRTVNESFTVNGTMPILINESGIISLALLSKLPSAKPYRRWVTSEVLPTIRKTGSYSVKQAPALPDFTNPVIAARAWADEVEKKQLAEAKVAVLTADNAKQTQLIGELKPKADYTDKILQNKGIVPITAIAKDYGMSGKAMNQKLHELKIIYKIGKQWLLYADYQAKGYTHSETIPITRSNGMSDVTMNTKWTQKGRLFLYEKLKKHGILPMIEQC